MNSASQVRLFLVLLAALQLLPIAARGAAIEEVIVSAQKRDESAQDVGISISAFSARQLEELGIKNTVDITQQVPGLHLFSFSPAFTVFSLRGVSQNNFQDNLEAPVAVYLDGAYVASMNALNMQLFDMERVEVLRGPQGTLFGRNATGGVIQYVTHKAVEEEGNGYVEAIAGDFGAYSVEGAFGGAFSENARGRLSGRWEQSDGYVEPGSAFGIDATGRDTNGADGYAVRGNLQLDASDNVLVDLTASYAKDDDVPTGVYIVSFVGIDPNTGVAAFDDAFLFDPVNGPVGPAQDFPRTPITGDGFHHFSASDPFALSGDPRIENRQPFMDREMTTATGTITANLDGGMQFVSITNWMEMDKFYVEDSAGGLVFFPYNTINEYDQVSQELRLANSEGPFRWQVGGYYLDMTWDTFQSVQGAAILSGVTGSPSETQKQSIFGVVDSRNWSVFGQVEYDLASAWTLILGARWSQDDKDLDLRRVLEDVPQGLPPTEVFNVDNLTTPGIDTIDYGDWAGRVQLNFKPSDDALVYLAYNRGIKGGNWSLDPLGFVAEEDLKHDPEKLNSYELGFKTDFMGGSARLNGAVYFYDYKDYQAFSIFNLTPQVTNSDAESMGGELEFTVSPTDGLDFMVGAAYIDSEVEAVPDVFGGVITDVDFPTAPELSLNVLGRYGWSALGGELAVQLDGQWNDDQFLEGTNSNASFESSYSVWNGRISYDMGDKGLGIAVWVKNLTDEEYRIYNLDLGLLGFIEQVYAPPRQYGVTVSYRW
ncbi:MAG TPA: TonB-dependent receptor [Steroidobacteraceae bacterium]|nr:TonB-dependent receptor [Steroidobacteraceae bacterium]